MNPWYFDPKSDDLPLELQTPTIKVKKVSLAQKYFLPIPLKLRNGLLSLRKHKNNFCKMHSGLVIGVSNKEKGLSVCVSLLERL